MRRWSLTEICLALVTAGFLAFLLDLTPVTN